MCGKTCLPLRCVQEWDTKLAAYMDVVASEQRSIAVINRDVVT